MCGYVESIVNRSTKQIGKQVFVWTWETHVCFLCFRFQPLSADEGDEMKYIRQNLLKPAAIHYSNLGQKTADFSVTLLNWKCFSIQNVGYSLTCLSSNNFACTAILPNKLSQLREYDDAASDDDIHNGAKALDEPTETTYASKTASTDSIAVMESLSKYRDTLMYESRISESACKTFANRVLSRLIATMKGVIGNSTGFESESSGCQLQSLVCLFTQILPGLDDTTEGVIGNKYEESDNQVR